LESFADKNNIDLTKPWKKLSKKVQKLLLFGSGKRSSASYQGIIPELQRWYENTTSEGFRSHILENFMHRVPCATCEGSRLNAEPAATRFGDHTIFEITQLNIEKAFQFFHDIKLSKSQEEIAGAVLREINNRLRFLKDVGLGYITLSRSAPSLSGGEAQRIRLASQIGSALVGVLYVLDEPSIGLHQRDNRKLIDTLIHLRNLGNTILVVEHDMETMESADHIVDFGPGAGLDGGYLVAQGSPTEIRKNKNSITGAYLDGRKEIPIPQTRRTGNGNSIQLLGAAENNLKTIDAEFPLGVFACVTGVSGSGKSTLITEILYKGLHKQLNKAQVIPGQHKSIVGMEHIDKVIEIDQKPIGRTPRSNPSTYVKVFDHIRNLFCELPDAKMRGYKAGRFSFNVRGGRCEACSGDGYKTIEMHFLPDVFVECEVCKGKRFNRETLQVKYKGHSIADVLDLSVKEAMQLFENFPKITRILETLDQVGLDYIHLGQPAPTLSGGEAQRIKLAKELSRRDTGQTLYILDEPTTGLHFEDILKLSNVLNQLVERGNTVIVIEHNLDVIKSADYIIDLGPEGGDGGGTIVAQGTPEEIAICAESYTGHFLQDVLGLNKKQKRSA